MAQAQPPPSLPVELHIATRKEHALLNQSIIARLPLCLPPYTNDPFLYAAGITAFSNVYFTIEIFWEEFLRDEKSDPQRRQCLQTLYTEHLFRTARLRADLKTLKSQLKQDQRQYIETIEKRSKWIKERIHRSLQDKPHVLLAYTWAMYLALFNGGRWMRQQFLNAGPDFWLGSQTGEPGSRNMADCLSLWYFDGTHDGEDIKQDFKNNLPQAEAFLTERQKADVILEAKNVFALCSDIVAFLDESLAESVPEGQSEHKDALESTASYQADVSDAGTLFDLLAVLAMIWRILESACAGWISIRPSWATKHNHSS